MGTKRLVFLVLLAFFSAGCARTMVFRAGTTETRPASAPQATRGTDLNIPPGHLPPPGMCRIWHPGRPPGHQPRPGRCDELRASLPAGAWLVHRSSDERVRVAVCDRSRAGTIVTVRIYAASTGRFLREEKP